MATKKRESRGAMRLVAALMIIIGIAIMLLLMVKGVYNWLFRKDEGAPSTVNKIATTLVAIGIVLLAIALFPVMGIVVGALLVTVALLAATQILSTTWGWGSNSSISAPRPTPTSKSQADARRVYQSVSGATAPPTNTGDKYF